MKGIVRGLAVAISAIVVGRSGIGCAANEDSASPEERGADAGHEAPSDADARADAAASADADSGERATCSADGWCYTSLPSADSFEAGALGNGNSQYRFQLTSVWVAPDHRAWAVTTGGHVLRWDPAGWKVVTVVDTPLRSIWGATSTDLWIGGDNGLVLHGMIAAGTLAFSPVPIDTSQKVIRVWGTSETEIWASGEDGVFHLDGAPREGPPSFVRMRLPSDYGEYSQFRPAALWGSANDVWIGGTDQTWCDPVRCEFASELLFLRWKGDDGGDSSWDRVRVVMGPDASLPSYSNVTAANGTNDGVQIASVILSDFLAGVVVRIAANEAQLPPGIDGIHHDGAYAWSLEATGNYLPAQGVWATDHEDVWLVGASGVRHYDGASWQIGRLALAPGEPLLRSLHSIHAAIDPPNSPDLWVVGDDVALHRSVTR